MAYQKLKGDDLVSDSWKIINDNTEALRSNFSGSSFPADPLKGQRVFINDEWYTYNGSIWVKDDALHSHDARYYQKSEINNTVNTLNNALNTKAHSSHNHDGAYPSKKEFDNVNSRIASHEKAGGHIHGAQVGNVGDTLVVRNQNGLFNAGTCGNWWDGVVNVQRLQRAIVVPKVEYSGMYAIMSDYRGGDKRMHCLSQPFTHGESGSIHVYVFSQWNKANSQVNPGYTDNNGLFPVINNSYITLQSHGAFISSDANCNRLLDIVRLDYYQHPFEHRLSLNCYGFGVNWTGDVHGSRAENNPVWLFWQKRIPWGRDWGIASLGFYHYPHEDRMRLGVVLLKHHSGAGGVVFGAVNPRRHSVYRVLY